MKKRLLPLFILFLSSLAWAACPNIAVPAVAGTKQVCHDAYIALYDEQWHVPRLVAYELTAQQSLGCLPRKPNFHKEEGTASPDDYNKSGYDLGHMGPAEDFSYSDDAETDSFSMVNVAPQLPGLNRQEWERLEETVRAWAWSRKDVIVYVGPILSKTPKTLGNNVAIPDAFFKIVMDKNTGDVIAFVMPQQNESKGDLTPFMTSIGAINRATGFDIRPIVHKAAIVIWPDDLTGWRKARSAACKH